ncbi:hypothetical protein NDU88_010227 [Pleurodeles waltl]|uniref:Uncharacterized protein n=1 Tax=Pleurodeles waltl TaxID=8319 RepID=A0AAV7S209_PLEWA|nr:hypothetical protein NDU88_010227 [Pleurodeles waltl]
MLGGGVGGHQQWVTVLVFVPGRVADPRVIVDQEALFGPEASARNVHCPPGQPSNQVQFPRKQPLTFRVVTPLAHRASAARVEHSRYKGEKDSPAATGRATPSPSGSGWASVFQRRSEWSRRFSPAPSYVRGRPSAELRPQPRPAPRYGSGPPPKWSDRPFYAQGLPQGPRGSPGY